MHQNQPTPARELPSGFIDPAPGSGPHPVVIPHEVEAPREKLPLSEVVSRWQVILSAIALLFVLGVSAAFFYLSFATDDELSATKGEIMTAIGTLKSSVDTQVAAATSQRSELVQSIAELKKDEAQEIKEINSAIQRIATDVAKIQGVLEARKK